MRYHLLINLMFRSTPPFAASLALAVCLSAGCGGRVALDEDDDPELSFRPVVEFPRVSPVAIENASGEGLRIMLASSVLSCGAGEPWGECGGWWVRVELADDAAVPGAYELCTNESDSVHLFWSASGPERGDDDCESAAGNYCGVGAQVIIKSIEARRVTFELKGLSLGWPCEGDCDPNGSFVAVRCDAASD
jgi:hypothetical protein